MSVFHHPDLSGKNRIILLSIRKLKNRIIGGRKRIIG